MRMNMFSLWLGLVLTIQPANCDIQPTVNDSGFHCGGYETLITYANGSIELIEHYHCVECMFPQNCQADNHCKIGSTGSVCEKCASGYYRMGNSCTSCPVFPWPVVSLCVFLLVLLVAMYIHGLTDSLCTKLKLLCSFLQYVLLTFHIKIAWPVFLVDMFSIVNFATFNTIILLPECMLQSLPKMISHYMNWLTALCIPIVIVLIGRIVDKKMSKVLTERQSDPTEDHMPTRLKRRTTVRRLVVMVVLVMYMPATLSCIRTFLCSDTIPKLLVLDETTSVFLLDNELSCEEFSFQTMNFVATFYLMIFGLLMPVGVIFFTLRQKKWNLLYSDWFLYCPIYEAYKERYCFWEAVPLIRKLVAIVITEAYPFSAMLQIVVQLGMTGLYLQAVIALRPFRPCYWSHDTVNVHIIFEVLSTMVVGLVQVIGLLIVTGQYQYYLEYIGVSFIYFILLVWVIMVLVMPFERQPEIDFSQVNMTVTSPEEKTNSSKGKNCLLCCKKKRVGPDPEFLERVNKNKSKVNF